MSSKESGGGGGHAGASTVHREGKGTQVQIYFTVNGMEQAA